MKPIPFELGSDCNLLDLYEICILKRPVVLSAKTASLMRDCRRAMMKHVAESGAIYGINTGFGEFASVRIPAEQCKQLQVNLIRSHACGAGEPMDEAQARGIMFLRANELAKCHSGVRPEVVRTLADCLNKNIIPFVPSRGSVGASGDLAPSAHVAMTLIGEGRAATLRSGWQPAAAVLKKAAIKPLVLEEKEGLALINGTQAMQSVGGLALLDTLKVWLAATAAAGMTLEALKGTPAPLDERIHQLKPHPGQTETARILAELMRGSEIRRSHQKGDKRVQDPYSLRCTPQVHGAVRDAMEYAITAVETEMRSITDNPIVVWDEGTKFRNLSIISGGNFHGQAVSMAFDFACTAMVSLGNISERRLFQVVSDSTKILPLFLAKNSGIESGWMITQYTAASIASENKTLAHPASSDSIPTSANKEDFVSMGMWSALKLKKAAENAAYIVAIELLAGAQGLEFHKPLKPGKGIELLYKKIRKIAPAIQTDESLSDAINNVQDAILAGEFMNL